MNKRRRKDELSSDSAALQPFSNLSPACLEGAPIRARQFPNAREGPCLLWVDCASRPAARVGGKRTLATASL